MNKIRFSILFVFVYVGLISTTDPNQVLIDLQNEIERLQIEDSNKQMDKVLEDVNAYLDSRSIIEWETEGELKATIFSYTQALDKAIKWIEENVQSIHEEHKDDVESIKEDLKDAKNILNTIQSQVKLINHVLEDDIPARTIISLKANIIFRLYADKTVEAAEKAKALTEQLND